jgi:outer membrane protein
MWTEPVPTFQRRWTTSRACLALLAFGASSLPGLSFGQTHEAPAPPVGPIAPANPVADGPPQRVLTLAQVQQLAMRQPQMLVARAQTDVAVAQADQARAPLLPQVTGTAQYTRETGNYVSRPGFVPQTVLTYMGNPITETVVTPTPSLSQSFDVWNFGVNATQLIYDFGQTSGKFSAASANADATRLAETTTRITVLLNVRRMYFNARAMKELVNVARETLDDQNNHLAQVVAMVSVGTQPQIALAQQQASVANAKVQLITSQNNYETSKAQLNQAAGIAGGTDYDVGSEESPPVEDEDQSLEALVSKAIAARPELAQLVKQREAQESTLSAAKGGYGPAFSAAAGFTEAGLALDNLVPNWSAGLLLNWPFFQGGLTVGQVHQAQAGLNSIDAQTSLEELQVRVDVDTARLAVRAAKATIGAAQDAVTSAKEQLRLAEQRYATGVGNIIELNDAQVAYTTSAAQLVQALYTLASARAQLLAALGRT